MTIPFIAESIVMLPKAGVPLSAKEDINRNRPHGVLLQGEAPAARDKRAQLR
jgi:hypothetical protein